uniref:Titin n=1 Tax=Oryzias latipes TaxID=8090 RepID=A0A3B3HK91_ORYLA
MTITWSAPGSDGGTEITSYIIEKKDRAGIKWTRCNRQKVTDLSFRVTGLSTDHEYEFRVAAENIVGVGEPSLPSSYYKACDPKFKPSAPTYVNVIDSTKTSITVSWGKPLSDGGSEIQGYIVEVCKAEEEQWTMVTPPTGLRVNKYEITKLTEGQEYKIQVCALNKLGVGEPLSLSGTIKPEEKFEPPQIHLHSELRKGITVKAGGSVRIHIPFKGRPAPEIMWMKDEGNLTEKAVIEKAVNFTQLSIDSCDRNDSGKYTLSLTNSSGCVSEFVSVKVLDTPGPPQNLVVKSIKKDSVTLEWDVPLNDGGSKIRNYVIDKRESTRKAYANVSTKCLKTTFKVENLIEGALYYFRVMAENEYGIGQAVETKTASKASEVPLPVGKVFLTDVTKTSATLAWEKPEHDGGSRIGGYLIEMLPKGTDKWGVATNTKTCDGTVTGLTAGAEYQFRIIAYNEKGKSEPRVLAAPVIASDMTMEPNINMQFNTVNILNTACKDDFEDLTVVILDKPGPPKGPVNVIEVSNTFVHLSWEPPEYTGGCQVKNYIVEKRDATTTVWQPVNTHLARTALKITKLKTSAEYQFRIIAENRYGKSVPLESKAIVVQYPYKPPGPPGTPFVKYATKEMMIVEWNEPVIDGGSAVIGYHLESKERNSILWNKLNKTLISDTQFKICNLEENIGYEFRVYAENIVGIGRCSKVSESYVARDPSNEITKDSMVVSWTAPEHTGGAEIQGYHLEKRSKDSVRWTKCNRQKLTDTHFKVTGLTTDHFYEFRVAAENEAGVGDLSELSLFYRACDATTPPGPPHHPKVTDYTKYYDGGSPVTNYIVLKRETSTPSWTEVSKSVARNSIKVTKLTKGEEYQFRIKAENRFGAGDHIDSKPVMIKLPYSKSLKCIF